MTFDSNDSTDSIDTERITVKTVTPDGDPGDAAIVVTLERNVMVGKKDPDRPAPTADDVDETLMAAVRNTVSIETREVGAGSPDTPTFLVADFRGLDAYEEVFVRVSDRRGRRLGEWDIGQQTAALIPVVAGRDGVVTVEVEAPEPYCGFYPWSPAQNANYSELIARPEYVGVGAAAETGRDGDGDPTVFVTVRSVGDRLGLSLDDGGH